MIGVEAAFCVLVVCFSVLCWKTPCKKLISPKRVAWHHLLCTLASSLKHLADPPAAL